MGVKAARGTTPLPTDRVKRSVSIRPDLDGAVVELAGKRGYSTFVNDALIVALQARGIEDTVEAFEAEHGELTAAEKKAARDRRIAAARRAR